MRRLLLSVLASISLASTADGAERAFESTLSLRWLGLPEVAGPSRTGVANVDGDLWLDAVALPASSPVAFVQPVTDPIVTAGGLQSIRVTVTPPQQTLSLDPFGAFSMPALAVGTLPLPGRVRICLFYAGCNSGSLDAPTTAGPGTRGVGLGGTLAVGSGAARLSVAGAPWTLQTATAWLTTTSGAQVTAVSAGAIHGPLSFTFSPGHTVNGIGGVLEIVTPLRVTAGSGPASVAFARRRIRFLPEPAFPVIALAAALLVLGTARRQRP